MDTNWFGWHSTLSNSIAALDCTIRLLQRLDRRVPSNSGHLQTRRVRNALSGWKLRLPIIFLLFSQGMKDGGSVLFNHLEYAMIATGNGAWICVGTKMNG